MTVEDDRLSGALQENILTLLCFDEKYSRMARHSLTPSIFESAVFKEIAAQAMDYIDQFQKPIAEHLPDTLEHILAGDDTRKAASFKRVIDALYASKDSYNGEYVVKQLHKFVRQQNMKSAIRKAVECIEDGRIDDAEVEMQRGLNSQAVAFEVGTNVSDPVQATRFFDVLSEGGFPTMIQELDLVEAMPRRKELAMLIAPRGRGKSWFLTHLAKAGIVHRATVLIVTLEMSEERYTQRFLQSFFSISKRHNVVKTSVFKKDKEGALTDIVQEEIERMSLSDPNIRSILASHVKRRLSNRPPLIIKSFPTAMMTIPMLRAYLDGLERFENITPDMIIIDYPDLMAFDIKNLRTELGQICAQIRGIGVERNAAMIIVSQGNREAEDARTVTGSMVAEDISKMATADTVYTYSQTPAEKRLGLARIGVDKSRNDEDKFQVLISQAYQMGQFSLDSVRMNDEYLRDFVDPPPKKYRGQKEED